jgi:hypothetical protein
MCYVGGVARKLYARQEISGLSPRCRINFLPCTGSLVPGVGTGTNDPGL